MEHSTYDVTTGETTTIPDNPALAPVVAAAERQGTEAAVRLDDLTERVAALEAWRAEQQAADPDRPDAPTWGQLQPPNWWMPRRTAHRQRWDCLPQHERDRPDHATLGIPRRRSRVAR